MMSYCHYVSVRCELNSADDLLNLCLSVLSPIAAAKCLLNKKADVKVRRPPALSPPDWGPCAVFLSPFTFHLLFFFPNAELNHFATLIWLFVIPMLHCVTLELPPCPRVQVQRSDQCRVTYH